MNLQQAKSDLQSMPRIRIYLYGVAALAVIGYLAWSTWGGRPQPPSSGFQPGKPAIDAPKVPGPTVGIKIIPKSAVNGKYPKAPIADTEEWIDSTEVPDAPNGATVLTKIDTVTGEATSEVKINEAPWFALERKNTIGAGYRVGTDGNSVPVYYRRDILRIKDLHLVGEIGGRVPLDNGKGEAHVTALAEYRW